MTSQMNVRGPGTSVSRALALLTAAILVASVAPGTPVGSWPEMVAGLRAGATFAIQDPALVTLVERFVTFLPLGWLVFQHFARREVRRPLLASCLVLSLFALTLEVAQGVIQYRHARLSDLVLAVGFGCAGIIVAAWLGKQPSPRQIRRLLVSAVVLGNVAAMLVVVLTIKATELGGWDCEYPLLVANEQSGDRPWLGHARGLALYPRALTADEVGDLVDAPLSAEGAMVRQAMGALVLYSFAAIDSGRILQLLEYGPPSDLLLLPSASSSWQVKGDALQVQGPTTIRSAGPARELCSAIMKSKEFTAEVEIAAIGVAQGGPARIVSHSSDATRRNFTLGEEFGRLVVRVRTPWNGPNGTNLPLETDTEVLSEGWHHVVFGYGTDGAAFLFLDGAQVARVPYRTMVLIGEETAIRIAVVLGLLLAILGGVASVLMRSRCWPSECARMYAALLPALVSVSVAVWLGDARDYLLLALAVVAPGVGMIGARAFAAAPAWQQRTSALG